MTSTTATTNEPGIPFRIGTAPVNWNNFDLDDWRPVVPFPTILDEMRGAGYDATEWDQSFGADVDVLNRERDSRGMSFVGAYRWLDFVNDDQFEQDLATVTPFLATLQGIGASHLIVADSLRQHRVAIAGSVPADGSASLDDARYGRLVANLFRLAEVANQHGLDVHYHNHVGSYIESPAETRALAERLDPARVDLCFDTGHFAFGGGDALDFVHENRSAIGFIHLKDVDQAVLADARAKRWSFHEALRHYIFSPIGEGNARIADIVALLVATDFQGNLIIEQDTCRGDSTVNARNNLRAVQQFARAALQEGANRP